MLRKALTSIGCDLDQRERQLMTSFPDVSEWDPEATSGIMAAEPHLEITLRGMAVIHKQPDWEVDGKFRSQQQGAFEHGPPALSLWLRTALPRSQHPLTRNADLDYGFLHRLDVPSSGLILSGTTFTGLLSLRLQLDTYLVERQYGVWGHELASAALREVAINIDPMTVDSRRSFVSDAHGKPAKSWFAVPAHFQLPLQGRPLDRPDSCSAFIIRIRTGRRHQIRAHMLHVGHPTVVDAKYACSHLIFHHLASFEQGYLRSGCPT